MNADLETRLAHVFAAVAVAVAGVGLVTAYRTELTVRRPEVVPSYAMGMPRAPTYAEERERHHDNRLRHPGNLRAMSEARPDAADAGAVTDEMRAEALAKRARNRAYDGAPPTIPHPVAQQSWPNCMTCHERGMRVAANTASAICHTTMQSCTQCHVVSDGPVPGAAPEGGPPLDSTFAGLESTSRGERAWPGAPPTIPHATLMRARCSSCHGDLALGLRTSHPWRQSCTQCHAPSATLDQRPVFATAAP